MADLSGSIARLIHEMLREAEDGRIEIGRNELAERFACSPSQINYVLATRFTPHEGYVIESRRGGSGYIRIVKVEMEKDARLKYMIEEGIGDTITRDRAMQVITTLYESGSIEKNEARLMLAAMEDSALGAVTKDRAAVRAGILRAMLLALLRG